MQGSNDWSDEQVFSSLIFKISAIKRGSWKTAQRTMKHASPNHKHQFMLK
jgi:hypothetical protein